MQRLAIGIEYDGSGFHGWQIQRNGRSVQETLEQGVSAIACHPLRVTGAGRTDSGVHATCQIAHFDTSSQRPMHAWVLGVNANLPADVNVLWAYAVPADFHARFSALERSYAYLILNRKTRSSLTRDRYCWIHDTLDAQRMHEAATYLLGTHDFTSFRAAACQAKTAHRTIRSIAVRRAGEMISIRVTANAFLHHMVRNIAGVLLAVGRGRASTTWTRELLALRDRTAAGITAPANGLYLTDVRYDRKFGLPASPDGLLCPIAGEPVAGDTGGPETAPD